MSAPYGAAAQTGRVGDLTRITPEPENRTPEGRGLGQGLPAVSPYGLSRSSFEKLSELDLGPLDHATKTRLVRLTEVLPFAAFAAAAELAAIYSPRSRSAYMIAVLRAWHREGRYA